MTKASVSLCLFAAIIQLSSASLASASEIYYSGFATAERRGSGINEADRRRVEHEAQKLALEKCLNDDVSDCVGLTEHLYCQLDTSTDENGKDLSTYSCKGVAVGEDDL